MRVASSLDTSALTEPIDREGLARYRATLPAPPPGAKRGMWWSSGVLIGASAFVSLFFVWVILDGGEVRGDDVVMVVLCLAFAAVLIVLTAVTVASDPARTGSKRQYRLSRFAADNGMSYDAVGAPLGLPGMIFGERDAQIPRDVVRDASPRGLMIGNQTFTTGSGKNERTHRWGFATVSLGTTLPPLVLDATSNNSLGASNLPVSLDPAQRLSLEGDFDRHFRLYAPRGYERDALYLFTPDIMARFVDHAAALDVEIVDDRLLLYSRHDLSTLDPEVWEWLLATLDALTAKVDQWQRWRDDRLGTTRVTTGDGMPRIVRPPRGVAAPGRRLTEKVHWIWLVLGLAAAGYGLWSMFEEVFGPFSR